MTCGVGSPAVTETLTGTALRLTRAQAGDSLAWVMFVPIPHSRIRQSQVSAHNCMDSRCKSKFFDLPELVNVCVRDAI